MIANSGLCFPVRLNQFLVTPLGLLLTFRTQQSIARFNEAVTNWGKISSLCRSLSRTLFYHDERVPRVLWPSCGLPALSTRRPNRSTHNNQTFTVGCCERIFTASLRKTYACSPKCCVSTWRTGAPSSLISRATTSINHWLCWTVCILVSLACTCSSCLRLGMSLRESPCGEA